MNVVQLGIGRCQRSSDQRCLSLIWRRQTFPFQFTLVQSNSRSRTMRPLLNPF